MRIFILIVMSVLLISCAAPVQDGVAGGRLGGGKQDCFCTQQYDPVCGDGQTYSNACFADCVAVSYTPGEC